MKHELKTELWSYFAIESGEKTFEIRYNDDRGFQKGDIVILKPFDGGCYDTQHDDITVKITYVTNFHQQEGWCVFGFTKEFPCKH